jgi:RimJ/RimL family protein N-acetyltransferase
MCPSRIIGHIIILPKAQRTHVLSHAAGLLMHYALDFPYISTYDPALKKFIKPPTSSSSTSSTTPPSKALGLRRLQWQAHVTNTASIRSAGRLGFQPEGIVRMHGTARGGDEEGRQGDGAGMSRSNWVGSITWKDWEAGGAGLVDGLVAR